MILSPKILKSAKQISQAILNNQYYVGNNSKGLQIASENKFSANEKEKTSKTKNKLFCTRVLLGN